VTTALRLAEFVHESLPSRVVFGAGAARERLRGELVAAGAERILLVVAPAERELGLELATPLADLVVGVFDDARPHVPVDVAVRATAAARAARANWILSVGGGSTTGTAKAVALELALPVAAVPTTYAGSEMTPVWGLTEAGRKTTGRSPLVLPRLVVYDPELTVTLSGRITAASAGNGLAHCVEALYAPGTGPVAALFAEEGIRALVAGAPGAVADPHDLTARSLTLYGAYLAGAAFAHAGSDIHHKICHVLGGALDLPHAETHSVVLPHVTAFVEPALGPDVRKRLRAALGRPGAAAGSSLYACIAALGLPLSLRELGLEQAEISRLVPEILDQVPATTPRPPSGDDLRRLLESAWQGSPPG
jgi:alcohol dehydrogenase class IV